MRTLLAGLGVVGGFAVARSLDALWVMHWYAGDRDLGVALQAVLDVVALAGTGALAGALGLWLAGRGARGIGAWIGLLLLGATAADVLLGIANAPRWHEALTALVQVPAVVLAGGSRLRILPRS